MTAWTAVVIIIAIITFGKLRAAKYGHHHGDVPSANADAAYTASLEREVAEMRKRIEVLERIATDEREPRRLASEIEALRDS